MQRDGGSQIAEEDENQQNSDSDMKVGIIAKEGYVL